jgi:hypothetical protein
VEVVPEQGILAEANPLVPLFYHLLREGDVSPARLEQLISDLERMPAPLALVYEMPDLARHALDAAARVEALRRGPVPVARLA